MSNDANQLYGVYRYAAPDTCTHPPTGSDGRSALVAEPFRHRSDTRFNSIKLRLFAFNEFICVGRIR